MSDRPVPSGVDRTALRLVDWEDHVAEHEVRWREYWLDQPVSVRQAGAMQCRWRVHGPLPPVDRTRLTLVDLTDLDR
jgi:hypothetical protein